MTRIRRLQIGEGELYKRIGLSALQEAPYAFTSTYESALRRSAESWQEQADGTAQGADRATFIAFSEDAPIGIAALYRLPDQADVGEVLQVWVAPEYRGKSVARELMDTLLGWAAKNRFQTIIAGVAKANARALQFYLRLGFALADKGFPAGSAAVMLVRQVGTEPAQFTRKAAARQTQHDGDTP